MIDSEQQKEEDAKIKELERLQQKEIDAAAKEAAKDLDLDYGDKNEDMDEQQKELQLAIQAQEQAEKDQQNDQGLIAAMNKQTSLTHVLKRGNFVTLANTATGLDSLIGASTA